MGLRQMYFKVTEVYKKWLFSKTSFVKSQHLAETLTLWSTDGEDNVELLCCCLEKKNQRVLDFHYVLFYSQDTIAFTTGSLRKIYSN